MKQGMALKQLHHFVDRRRCLEEHLEADPPGRHAVVHEVHRAAKDILTSQEAQDGRATDLGTSPGRGRRDQAKAGDGLLPEFEFLHLAIGSGGIGVHDGQVFWNLGARDAGFAELPDVVGSEGHAVLELHEGGDFLPVQGAGDAHDLDVLDGGVGEQELLDLPRVNILPPANDHVLGPAGDPDQTLFVLGGQVAAVEPALRVDGLGRRLGHPEIAGHDIGTPAAELPLLSGRQGAGAPRGDDLDLHAGQGGADGRGALRERQVAAGEGDRGRGFGQAIRDAEFRHPQGMGQVPDHRFRAGCASHEAPAQGGDRDGFFLQDLELGDEHGRDAMQEGAATGRHRLQHLLGPELHHRDHGRAVRQAEQGSHHGAETVKKRQGDAQPVLVAHGEKVSHAADIVQQVGMAEHGPLGKAGRARGVLDHGNLIGLAGHQALPGLLIALGQELIPAHQAAIGGFAHDHQPAQGRQRCRSDRATTHPAWRRRFRTDLPDGGQGVAGGPETGLEKQRDGLGLFQHIGQLEGTVAGVDRHQHDPAQGAPQLELDPLRDVGGPDGQMFPRLDVQGRESPGNPAGAGFEFPIGEPETQAMVDHRRLVPMVRHGPGQQGANGCGVGGLE